tara:strand:+ start:1181 stop:1423 length:243 start_codon:yes stop_codon:yes gene_type:complete
MRNVINTTLNMLLEIPKTEEILRNDIQKIFENLGRAPPEKISSNFYWNELSSVLNKHISVDDYNEKEWCKKVIDIFQDKL